METFASFGDFATHLATVVIKEKVAENRALTKAAKVIQKEAKQIIGEYQTDMQPFVDWAELADSTKSDRVAQGFPENEPLLRTGDLRDSIEYKVGEGDKVGDGIAHIGSDSPIAEYQELGTYKIPPRSFLGAAAVRKSDKVRTIIGEEVMIALTGPGVFNGAMSLDEFLTDDQ